MCRVPCAVQAPVPDSDVCLSVSSCFRRWVVVRSAAEQTQQPGLAGFPGLGWSPWGGEETVGGVVGDR